MKRLSASTGELIKGAAMCKRQKGFSLIELLVATVVLLVGVVAVVQMVPAAMQSNLYNRYDSTSVVIAQRVLDQMIIQPLSSDSFVDADANTRLLGDKTSPNTVVGGPLISGTSRINFTASAVANYNYIYNDRNEPGSPSYEVRWAVVTTTSGANVIAKRFFVGVWRRNATQVMPPVTLEAWVQY
jgi:prepilin-type N-terminal cleavage/methylation domain-containing protein